MELRAKNPANSMLSALLSFRLAEREIDLFARFSASYGYVFYVLRRPAA